MSIIVVRCGCSGESGSDRGEEGKKWGANECNIFRAIVNEYSFGNGRLASSLASSVDMSITERIGDSSKIL